VIDSPASGQSVYDEAIFISGSIDPADHAPTSFQVRAWVEDRCCAETQILFRRANDNRFGFRMLGRINSADSEPREMTLRVGAGRDDSGPVSANGVFAERTLRLVPARLAERPYGDVVSPRNETLLHRENIYGSGPPIEEPGVEVLDLLRAYLPDVPP
jgi:hypothetical protein